MKRIFLTLAAIILAVVMQAQEHMSFKGISMNTDITSFVSQLKADGFTVVYESDKGIILNGDFAGKSDCEVMVLPTQERKLVWKVVVIFPEKSSWYSLKSEYSSFKESYTEKYGKPLSYEYFSSPYEEGDGYEMTALAMEKCRYISFFLTDKGAISIEINSDKSVQVAYEDEINTREKSREQESSVMKDI